jgi:hypothetical protein
MPPIPSATQPPAASLPNPADLFASRPFNPPEAMPAVTSGTADISPYADLSGQEVGGLAYRPYQMSSDLSPPAPPSPLAAPRTSI